MSRVVVIVSVLIFSLGMLSGQFLLRGSATAAPPADNPNIFVELSKKVVPSVVNISTFATRSRGRMMSPYGDERFRRFFEEFFGPGFPGQPYGRPGPRGRDGDQEGPEVRQQLSLGTGFVIDKEGLILTNNHVVGEADEVQVKFTDDPNEDPIEAEIVGKDPELDVALLKVDSKRKLIPLKFGNSDTLQVGEYVMAVGNPFGKSHSVTHGIVSAKQRQTQDLLTKYIQTDAPINPGNSGGPLVNLKGEVIGINNAIDARAQGIGFAIPVNSVKAVLDQLKEKGKVDRGFIGVVVSNLTPEIAEQINAPKNLKAPMVTQVEEGGPADRAGIQPYDLITEFNGRRIQNSQDLIFAVTGVELGETTTAKIIRNGKKRNLKVKVDKKRPNLRGDRWNPEENRKKDSLDGDRIGLQIETVTVQNAIQYKLPKGTKGVVVTQVKRNSPAARAGLFPGDVIIEVNREKVTTVKQFSSKTSKNRSYLLRVQRVRQDGEKVFQVLILDLKDKD